MKKLATVSLVAIAALALAPKPASANDKALAALGGFIGGLIVGTNVNQSYHAPVYYAADCPPPATVVVVNGQYGYWQEAPIQVWIAPTWVIVRDRWDRPVRRYVAGHYETRARRVWVTVDRRHYDRHGSRHYDHRRYDGDRDHRRPDHRHDRD